jgi:SAM-dependent methyltransferase
LRKLVPTFLPHRYRDAARRALFAVLSVLYAGDRFECPVCGRTCRRWVSLGFPDMVCPHCSAFNRQRLMLLYLQREAGIGTRPLTLLHFAPEGRLMRRLSGTAQLEYIGGDLDPPRGARKLDITAIDLPTDSVDLALCSHVLEHVPDDAAAMGELRRVVRPGGSALIMGPVEYDRPRTYEDRAIVGPRARAMAFGQSDHVRVYGADFEQRLERAGFGVDPLRYGQRLSEDEVKRFGLDPDEIIYVCS